LKKNNSSDFKIWAIINLTPDSFFPQSRVESAQFVERCVECLSQGADILDIGAESSRPFSDNISEAEEWNRLNTPLNDLKKEIGANEFSRRISIDTYKPQTAQKVLELGVRYINDIRGGENPDLLRLVAAFEANIVLMHSQGNPKEMQINPVYGNVVQEVESFLKLRSQLALELGIRQKNIIWDTGIGFGKNLDHNLQLIKNASEFKKSGYPLLYGISRKSFIDKLLNIPQVELRGNASLVIHTFLALQNVDILRVHDVPETVMIRKIINQLI